MSTGEHTSHEGFTRHLDIQANGKAYEGFAFMFKIQGIPLIIMAKDQASASAAVLAITHGRVSPDISRGMTLLAFKKE